MRAPAKGSSGYPASHHSSNTIHDRLACLKSRGVRVAKCSGQYLWLVAIDRPSKVAACLTLRVESEVGVSTTTCSAPIQYCQDLHSRDELEEFELVQEVEEEGRFQCRHFPLVISP